MTTALELGLVAPVFFAALAGTALLRRYGEKKLLDVPNERSSHSQPVPRGGGVAFVLALFAGVFVLWWRGAIPTPLAATLFVGGGLVAAIGFWDDHVNLSARVRFALHLAAAALAVAMLEPVQRVPFGDVLLAMPAWLAWLLSLIAVTWLLNLYNFMDGIDGIAAGEAVCVAVGGALVAHLIDVELPGLLLLAAAAAGFLALNWPPARIFMGDAGSGFLGYAFAVYLLFSANADARFLWVWAILLAVFWVDATVTLVRRVAAGERWYAAHRTHAYQHAAARYGRHLPVTLAVIAIDLLVLLPLAAFAALRPQYAHLLAATVAAAVTALAVAFRAGRRPVPGEP